MKTEEEIQSMIEAIEEMAQDHHIWLETKLVRDIRFANYETILNILRWVLDEPIPTCSDTQTKGEENNG